MKKLLILLPLVLTVTACSMDSKPVASKNAKHVCIDGVTYIVISEPSGSQDFGYLSGKLDNDNVAIPCEVEVGVDNEFLFGMEFH